MLLARTLVLTFFTFTFLTSTLPAQTSASNDEGNATIAEVNGSPLTFAQLDQKEGNKLLQSRYTYYEAQRKALDELIDQELLQQEARKQKLTVDQLLDRDVKSKLPPDPTDAELRVTYEIVETDQPFDAMKDKILEHIREVRFAKAKAEYVKQLRSKANIMIELQPPQANVNVAGSVVRGNPNAQVMLVEFADYQCPYCQKVHPDLDKLQKEYGDKLAVVYKDFPLPMHANAEKAAEAARCAGEQGKFWEYHDSLFSSKKLEVPDLKDQARSLHLDTAKFDKCLDTGEQTAAVQKDLAEGRKLGISATPSFFVNGHYFSGAVTYPTLRDLVHQQLSPSLSSKKEASPTESSLR